MTARLKALRDEATAEQCTHHVDRNLCADHRPTRATTTEGESE